MVETAKGDFMPFFLSEHVIEGAARYGGSGTKKDLIDFLTIVLGDEDTNQILGHFAHQVPTTLQMIASLEVDDDYVFREEVELEDEPDLLTNESTIAVNALKVFRIISDYEPEIYERMQTPDDAE